MSNQPTNRTPVHAPTPAGRDIDRARAAVLARSPFLRSLGRVLARAVSLRDEIEEFLGVAEGTSLEAQWAKAGLPPGDEDGTGEAYHLLAVVEEAPAECTGFLWSLRTIIDYIESNAPGPVRRRKGNKARKHAADPPDAAGGSEEPDAASARAALCRQLREYVARFGAGRIPAEAVAVQVGVNVWDERDRGGDLLLVGLETGEVVYDWNDDPVRAELLRLQGDATKPNTEPDVVVG